MKLYFLGYTGSIQAKEASNTSLVVVSQGRGVLVDVSGSPFLALKRCGIDPLVIDLVLLTHAHIDHIYALPSLIHQLWLAGRTEVLTIAANEATIQVAQALVGLFSLEEKRAIFPIRWLVADDEASGLGAGGMQVVPFAVEHGVATLGYAFIEGKRRVVHLADCKAVNEHAPPAYEADLLIHEAGGLGDEEQRLAESGHSSARQAALMAVQLGARRLVIAHLPNSAVQREALLAEAQHYFAPTSLPVLFEGYEI